MPTTTARVAPTGSTEKDPRHGDPFYQLTLSGLFGQFKRESFAFKMICCYLFVEYVRPQSILPWLDFLPWAQVFLAATAVGLLTGPRLKWVSDPANVYMTLFLLVLVASSVFAEYPAVSFSHWFDFFGWYVIYFLIIHTVTTERRFIIFLVIFLAASFKLSFFGARTWAARGFSFATWGLEGPPGFFQNSGELSIQMLMAAPIAYGFARALKPYIPKWKYLIVMLLPITAAMTVLGASSRGAQIGMASQGALRAAVKKKFMHALFGALLISAALFLFLPAEQLGRLKDMGNDDTSEQRVLYWKHGLEMIKENPMLGVGYYNFAPYYEKTYSADLLFHKAQLPHNIFIQVGTDAGLVGLALFAMLIFRAYKCAVDIKKLRSTRPETANPKELISIGLTTALTGYLVAGQFVTVAYYPFFWINLAMLVALLRIGKDERNIERE